MIEYSDDWKIGNPTDIWALHKTLMGYDNVAYQHIHQPAKCFPSLANGVTVNGGASAWELGNFTEIVPADVIASAFDIHFIVFENASASDVYEIVLYSGAAASEIEIGRVRTRQANVVSGAANVPIQVPPQAANSRISAKVASSSGGDNVTISLFYHLYS